jgi:hypothetical protein
MTSGLRQVMIGGKPALRIAESPVAAVHDPDQPSAWYVVAISSMRMLGWVRGSRSELREKLIRAERELCSPEGAGSW